MTRDHRLSTWDVGVLVAVGGFCSLGFGLACWGFGFGAFAAAQAALSASVLAAVWVGLRRGVVFGTHGARYSREHDEQAYRRATIGLVVLVCIMQFVIGVGALMSRAGMNEKSGVRGGSGSHAPHVQSAADDHHPTPLPASHAHLVTLASIQAVRLGQGKD